MNKEYNVVPNKQSDFNFETNMITTYSDILLKDEFYPLYLFPRMRISYKDYSMFCRLVMRLPVGELYGACRQEDRNHYYLMNNYSFVYLFRKWVNEGLNLQDIFPIQDKIKLSTFNQLSLEQKINIKYNEISLSRIRIYSEDETDTLSKIYSFYAHTTAENKAAINLLVNDKRKKIYDFCERYESAHMNSDLSPDFERCLYYDMVEDLNMTSDEFIGLLKENNPEKNMMLLNKMNKIIEELQEQESDIQMDI